MSEVTIPLAHPFKTATGETVDKLALRRYKVAEYRQALRGWESPVDQEIAMIAFLAGMVPEDLYLLDSADYPEVQAAFSKLSRQAVPDLEMEPTDPIRLEQAIALENGAPLASLTLRRAKLGDMRAVQLDFEHSVDIECAMISRLAGIPMAVLDCMDGADYQEVLRRFQKMQHRGAGQGGLSTGPVAASPLVQDAA